MRLSSHWRNIKCKICCFQSAPGGSQAEASLPPLAEVRWGEGSVCCQQSRPALTVANPTLSNTNVETINSLAPTPVIFRLVSLHSQAQPTWPTFLEEKNLNNWELVKHPFGRFFVVINVITWQMLQRPHLLWQTSTLRLSQMRSGIVRIMIWSIFLVVKIHFSTWIQLRQAVNHCQSDKVWS